MVMRTQGRRQEGRQGGTELKKLGMNEQRKETAIGKNAGIAGRKKW